MSMTGNKGKVLFVYPNSEGYGGVPNGIALLSGCLRQAGFETKCFDTTFLKSPPLDHMNRQRYGTVDKSDASMTWGEWSPELSKKIPELFIKIIDEFKPDVIAVSFAEMDYIYGCSLLEIIHDKKIPIIAGGVFPTLCPEIVIENPCIDAVCIGEGEDALVEFAECIVERRDYSNVKNIWLKKDGVVVKNPLRPLKDMNMLPFQDWSIFDQRHFYKPYCGGFPKTAFIELSRGCHFDCTYCCNTARKKLFKGLGNYIRHRDVDKTIDEIVYLKGKWGIEVIFFIDDNFLAIREERFNYFCEQYQNRVNLPFYIQTRSETIREDFVKRLNEINVSTIAIGVEHGSEEYRKKYMHRMMSNDELKRSFDIVHKYGIRTTANIIMALPYEDENYFKETIKLLRVLKPSSVTLSYLQTFHGTMMHEMAVKEGYIKKDYIIPDTRNFLVMNRFPPDRIRHYYENFRKYIDGELEI